MRINITKNGSAIHLSRGAMNELKRILSTRGIDPYVPFVLTLSVGDEVLYVQPKSELDTGGDIG